MASGFNDAAWLAEGALVRIYLIRPLKQQIDDKAIARMTNVTCSLAARSSLVSERVFDIEDQRAVSSVDLRMASHSGSDKTHPTFLR